MIRDHLEHVAIYILAALDTLMSHVLKYKFIFGNIFIVNAGNILCLFLISQLTKKKKTLTNYFLKSHSSYKSTVKSPSKKKPRYIQT